MRAAVLIAVAVGLFVGSGAAGQGRGEGRVPPPLDLPGEPLPERSVPPPEREVPLAVAPPAAPPVHALRVFVRVVRVVGNTVLPEDALREAVAPYVGRDLSSEQLEALRAAITGEYVERGYVTSGAVLPDQDFADGVLQIRVVEGRLSEVHIAGNHRFATSYLERRIVPDPEAPVQIGRLEERLQLLQRDPEIETVHAALRPGLRPGESVLSVRVVEGRWVHLALDTSNDRSPVVGAINGAFDASVRSLTGRGDWLQLHGRFSRGLQDVWSGWDIPVTSADTRAGLRFHWAHSEVVEGSFAGLDIESDFLSGGVELTQPIYRSLSDELLVGLLAEWRRGRNFVDGFGFSFIDGADRGEATVAPLRAISQWVHRDINQVIALRSTISVGLPVLGATDVSGAAADSAFVSWIFQGQWARRFDAWLGAEVIARADLQLANDPLLSIEQFSIGGHASVRGYRENQLVRDNGFAASLELRVPLWRRPDGTPIVQLAPFTDVGRGWDDADRETSAGQTLASIGVGLRVFPNAWLRGEIYWGHRLVDVGNPHDDLQDAGIYFRITSLAF